MDTMEYVLAKGLESSNPQLIKQQGNKETSSMYHVFWGTDNKDLDNVFQKEKKRKESRTQKTWFESWPDPSPALWPWEVLLHLVASISSAIK